MTLIERLFQVSEQRDNEANRLCLEAANAIEALQAENERLKEKLESWKDECHRVQALFEKETLRASELHESRDALAVKLVTLTDMQKQYAKRYRFAFIESPEWTYAVCKWDGSDWLPISNEDEVELDAAIDAAKGGQHEDA